MLTSVVPGTTLCFCNRFRDSPVVYGLIPCILEPNEHARSCRKNWAKLIQKIYEVDPLTCLTCQGPMRVISVIEDQEVIKAILKHLGLWLVTRKPEPRAKGAPQESQIDYSDVQISRVAAYLYRDPEYSLDVCVSRF
jgi:hypothetical protein